METLFLGLRVLVSLGAVLGLLWWLQRRFSADTGSGGKEQPAIKVVSRQPITPKASVVVVETGGQRFLLGVTEGSVNVLHTSELPADPEPGTEPGPDAGFAASLEAAGAGYAMPADPDAPYTSAQYAPAPGPHAAPRRAGRGAHALPSTHPVSARSALNGSILAPETWRQAGEFLRKGRKQ